MLINAQKDSIMDVVVVDQIEVDVYINTPRAQNFLLNGLVINHLFALPLPMMAFLSNPLSPWLNNVKSVSTLITLLWSVSIILMFLIYYQNHLSLWIWRRYNHRYGILILMLLCIWWSIHHFYPLYLLTVVHHRWYLAMVIFFLFYLLSLLSFQHLLSHFD